MGVNVGSSSSSKIDSLVWQAVFGADDAAKEKGRAAIRKLALESAVYPASIQGFYEAAGKGLYHGVTVPAMNIRGITGKWNAIWHSSPSPKYSTTSCGHWFASASSTRSG